MERPLQCDLIHGVGNSVPHGRAMTAFLGAYTSSQIPSAFDSPVFTDRRDGIFSPHSTNS